MILCRLFRIAFLWVVYPDGIAMDTIVLNALEYHSVLLRLNVAATDMILLIGLQTDMNEDYTYDSSRLRDFCS